MKNLARSVAAAVASLVLFSGSPVAAAEPDAAAPPPSPRFHLDVETDPTAFVFSGYSLHVGVGWKHARLDLGGYGMDMPSFMVAEKGWDASFHGAGAKLQLFLFDEQEGGFVGVDGGWTHVRADLAATGHHASADQAGVGVHAGWRFALPAGLYATPWIGVGYAFGPKDLGVDGKTYPVSPVTVFPAVHLGYRFL